jgi:hypothetical protein
MNKRRRFKQKRRRAERGSLSTWQWAGVAWRKKREELKRQWFALSYGMSELRAGTMLQRLKRTAHIYPGRVSWDIETTGARYLFIAGKVTSGQNPRPH